MLNDLFLRGFNPTFAQVSADRPVVLLPYLSDVHGGTFPLVNEFSHHIRNDKR